MKNQQTEVKTNTTNYPMDGHKAFCKRCQHYNNGYPLTESGAPSKSCKI